MRDLGKGNAFTHHAYMNMDLSTQFRMPNGSRLGTASKYQAENKEDKEDQKQHLCNPRRGSRDATEAEQSRDQREQEKENRPT
jgi:hypothetical protein